MKRNCRFRVEAVNAAASGEEKVAKLMKHL
jgi:hypothetical protein